MTRASVDVAKRWERREERWVAPGPLFDRRRHAVDGLAGDAAPKRFTCEHHYSGSYPAAVFRVGLFGPRARLVGIAVFSVGMSHAATARKYLAAAPDEVAELGRFVLLPEVEYNAETWFLARALRLLRAETHIAGVVSFADPLEWRDGARVVKSQHWGTIYQAANATYVGRSTPRTHIITPSGRPVSPRALSKIRRQERGAAYAERQIVAMGATPRPFGEAPSTWLRRVTRSDGFQRLRHPGNLVYVFGLTEAMRARVQQLHGSGLPYPKRERVA